MKYRKKPLHFFGGIGGGIFMLGFLTLLYLTSLKIFSGQSIGGRPLLFLGVLFVVVGIQIFFTGFLAELIINLSARGDRLNYPIKYISKK
jgi:hypothetical protein